MIFVKNDTVLPKNFHFSVVSRFRYSSVIFRGSHFHLMIPTGPVFGFCILLLNGAPYGTNTTISCI